MHSYFILFFIDSVLSTVFFEEVSWFNCLLNLFEASEFGICCLIFLVIL